jgi:chaperonin GroES
MNSNGLEIAGAVDPEREAKQKNLRLRPLYDRVLVRKNVPKEVLKNGLFIPDTAVERPTEGTVVAVGRGRVIDGKLYPLDIEVGTTILFGKYCGNEVEVLGEKMLLLKEDEIMGVYEEI